MNENEGQELQVERFPRTTQDRPQDLVVQRPTAAALIGATPEEIIPRATAIAVQLKQVIEKTGTSVKIGDRNHVMVEGWTTLLALMHVQPEVEWTRRLPRDGDEIVYECRVALIHWPTGRRVGVAESMASSDEDGRWNAAEFSVRSMAQTRAVGKAARLAFSWIMVLSGYAATPAEEMGGETNGRRAGRPASDAQRKFVYTLAWQKLGINKDADLQLTFEQRGWCKTWPEVTGHEASAMIEQLKVMPDPKPTATAPAATPAVTTAAPTPGPNKPAPAAGVGPDRGKVLERIRGLAATIQTRDKREILRLADGIEFLVDADLLGLIGLKGVDWKATDELSDAELLALGTGARALAERKPLQVPA